MGLWDSYPTTRHAVNLPQGPTQAPRPARQHLVMARGAGLLMRAATRSACGAPTTALPDQRADRAGYYGGRPRPLARPRAEAPAWPSAASPGLPRPGHRVAHARSMRIRHTDLTKDGTRRHVVPALPSDAAHKPPHQAPAAH